MFEMANSRVASTEWGSAVESDVAYFRRRACDERAAAMRAEHPQARMAHLELAARYQELSDAIVARERHLGLDTSDESGSVSA